MISIFLVDDEVLTIAALEKILTESSLEVNIIGKAYDGVTALEKIREVKPDLIITDIRMPNLNGLELMNALKKEKLLSKVLVLSAYRDFEYAKHAMEHGACGYIVKPIDKCKLFQLIDEINVKIEEEKSVKEIKNKLSITNSALRNNYLIEFVKGKRKYTSFNVEELGDVFPHENYFIVGIKLNSIVDEKSNEVQPLFSTKEMIEKLENISNNNVKLTPFYSEIDEIIIITSLNRNENSIHNDIDEVLERIKSIIDESFVNSGTIGTSCLNDELDHISNSYNEAKESLLYSFYKGDDAILRFEDIKYDRTIKSINIFDKEDYFIECVKLGIGDEALRLLEMEFLKLNSMRNIYPSLVYKEFYEIIIYINKALRGTTIKEDLKNYYQNIDINSLSRYTTLKKLYEFMKEAIEKIVFQINNERKSEDRKIIDMVKKYCENNYGKDISLDLISDNINMAKNYFCSFFKKNTGKNFWDYLTELRIEKAKNMLKKTTLKVNVISIEVGYKNSSHFGRIFKEYVGMSPAEYKEKANRNI
jgi:two-component system, response regulator YesN